MEKKGVKCVSVCQLLDMFSWWYRQAKTHCIHFASNKQNCNLQTPMLRVEPQIWPDQKQLVWHFMRSRVRAEALHYTHRTPLHDKRPPPLSLSRAGGTRSRVIKKKIYLHKFHHQHKRKRKRSDYLSAADTLQFQTTSSLDGSISSRLTLSVLHPRSEKSWRLLCLTAL